MGEGLTEAGVSLCPGGSPPLPQFLPELLLIVACGSAWPVAQRGLWLGVVTAQHGRCSLSPVAQRGLWLSVVAAHCGLWLSVVLQELLEGLREACSPRPSVLSRALKGGLQWAAGIIHQHSLWGVFALGDPVAADNTNFVAKILTVESVRPHVLDMRGWREEWFRGLGAQHWSLRPAARGLSWQVESDSRRQVLVRCCRLTAAPGAGAADKPMRPDLRLWSCCVLAGQATCGFNELITNRK